MEGGHLWQERFASYPMSENHLLAAVRHVELNPVRAGLVENPWSYKWSSAGAHVRGYDDELVRVGPLLEIVECWHSFIGEDITWEERDRLPTSAGLCVRTTLIVSSSHN